MEVTSLDAEEPSQLTLRATLVDDTNQQLDDQITTVTISSTCIPQSEFLVALTLDRSREMVIDVPNIPFIYLRFAGQYLSATCDGYRPGAELTPEQQALMTSRNVVSYPELLRYLYGYLGILSFQDFYQGMLRVAIEAGTTNANIASHVSPTVLDTLTEPQLFALSAYNVPYINEMYRVPNTHRYLQVKIGMTSFAITNQGRFEIKPDGLWWGNQMVHRGTVVSIYVVEEVACYLTGEGEIYEVEVQNQELGISRPIETGDFKFVALHGGSIYRVGITDQGRAYVWEVEHVGVDPLEIELDEVHSVVVAKDQARATLIHGNGSIAVYGTEFDYGRSPLAHYTSGKSVQPEVRRLSTRFTARAMAVDEGLILQDNLRVLGGNDRLEVLAVGPHGVMITSRLEAMVGSRVLELDVIGVSSVGPKVAFKARNGVIRSWVIDERGEWTRVYGRPR